MSLRSLFGRTLLGLALAAGACLLATNLPAHADELDDDIAALKAAAKTGELKEVTKAAIKLEEKPDSKVTKAFADLAKHKNDEIAILGIRKASARKSPDLLKLLKKKVGDKKLRKKSRPLYIAVVKACGYYDDKKVRKDLIDVAKKYIPMDAEFSCPAIEAYGATRTVESINQLMVWLAQVGSTGGGQGGKTLSQQTRDNYDKAAQAIYGALQGITGLDIADAKSWQDWWAENEKGYEIPDLDEVEEPVDFPSLREYTDQSYGFKIKLPKNPDGTETRPDEDGEGPEEYWEMQPSDLTEGRVKVRFISKGETRLRIEFCMFNTGNQNIKTLEQFNDFWVNEWKTNNFDEIRGDMEPKEMKIDGKDFLMNQAKGTSKGASKAWGPREARLYLTKVRHLIFYIFSDARLGTEDEIVKQGYAIIEGMELRD